MRAALAAAQAIAIDNAERLGAGLPPLRVRIGLHTGRVLAGTSARPGRINYTIIGDAVNIAARLEGLGKAAGRPEDDVTILLSGATAWRLPGRSPNRACGALQPARPRGRGGGVSRGAAGRRRHPAPATRAVAP